MKYALAVLAGLAGLAIFVPSAQAATDTCIGPNTCVAITFDQHSHLGAVRTKANTTAAWRLRCRQGSHSSLQTGTADPGEVTLIEPTLSNPNCTLRARGFADGVARVRVALS